MKTSTTPKISSSSVTTMAPEDSTPATDGSIPEKTTVSSGSWIENSISSFQKSFPIDTITIEILNVMKFFHSEQWMKIDDPDYFSNVRIKLNSLICAFGTHLAEARAVYSEAKNRQKALYLSYRDAKASIEDAKAKSKLEAGQSSKECTGIIEAERTMLHLENFLESAKDLHNALASKIKTLQGHAAGNN